MSKVRINLSTPAAATTFDLYLFQSCVRASLGGKGPLGVLGLKLVGFGGAVLAAWRGMVRTRWLDAEDGVRRSKRRRWESDETADRRAGWWGEKDAE